MKYIYLLMLVTALNYFNCNSQNNLTLDYEVYICSFTGKNQDIKHFLGVDEVKKEKGYFFKRYKGTYDLYEGNKFLNLFLFDEKTNVFKNLEVRNVSFKLKTDRKYIINILDSTDTYIKMKITSKRKDYTYSKLKGKSIIIECIKVCDDG